VPAPDRQSRREEALSPRLFIPRLFIPPTSNHPRLEKPCLGRIPAPESAYASNSRNQSRVRRGACRDAWSLSGATPCV
jgi:hypothetical protein